MYACASIAKAKHKEIDNHSPRMDLDDAASPLQSLAIIVFSPLWMPCVLIASSFYGIYGLMKHNKQKEAGNTEPPLKEAGAPTKQRLNSYSQIQSELSRDRTSANKRTMAMAHQKKAASSQPPSTALMKTQEKIERRKIEGNQTRHRIADSQALSLFPPASPPVLTNDVQLTLVRPIARRPGM